MTHKRQSKSLILQEETSRLTLSNTEGRRSIKKKKTLPIKCGGGGGDEEYGNDNDDDDHVIIPSGCVYCYGTMNN